MTIKANLSRLDFEDAAPFIWPRRCLLLVISLRTTGPFAHPRCTKIVHLNFCICLLNDPPKRGVFPLNFLLNDPRGGVHSKNDLPEVLEQLDPLLEPLLQKAPRFESQRKGGEKRPVEGFGQHKSHGFGGKMTRIRKPWLQKCWPSGVSLPAHLPGRSSIHPAGPRQRDGSE